MLELSIDDKRGVILKAALEVFITYGFRKTSMDDIARAAGMSRPALYQQFANKTDIFRALVQEVMTCKIDEAEKAFAEAGSFRDRLYTAIDRAILEMNRFVVQTPHGKELIGVSDELASDISDMWTEALIRVIANGIEQAQQEGQVDLDHYGMDASTIARTFTFAIEGLRWEVLHDRPIEEHAKAIVDFTARALERAAPFAGSHPASADPAVLAQ